MKWRSDIGCVIQSLILQYIAHLYLFRVLSTWKRKNGHNNSKVSYISHVMFGDLTQFIRLSLIYLNIWNITLIQVFKILGSRYDLSDGMDGLACVGHRVVYECCLLWIYCIYTCTSLLLHGSHFKRPKDGCLRYHGDESNVFRRWKFVSIKMLNVSQRRFPSFRRKVHCVGETWSLCVFLVFLSPQRPERRGKTSLPFSWWNSCTIHLTSHLRSPLLHAHDPSRTKPPDVEIWVKRRMSIPKGLNLENISTR